MGLETVPHARPPLQSYVWPPPHYRPNSGVRTVELFDEHFDVESDDERDRLILRHDDNDCDNNHRESASRLKAKRKSTATTQLVKRLHSYDTTSDVQTAAKQRTHTSHGTTERQQLRNVDNNDNASGGMSATSVAPEQRESNRLGSQRYRDNTIATQGSTKTRTAVSFDKEITINMPIRQRSRSTTRPITTDGTDKQRVQLQTNDCNDDSDSEYATSLEEVDDDDNVEIFSDAPCTPTSEIVNAEGTRPDITYDVRHVTTSNTPAKSIPSDGGQRSRSLAGSVVNNSNQKVKGQGHIRPRHDYNVTDNNDRRYSTRYTNDTTRTEGLITLIILCLVSHFNFLFIPCGRLSWLPVSFLLHVKYALSYRTVQLQDHTTLQHVQDHLIVNLFLQKLSCRVHLRQNL